MCKKHTSILSLNYIYIPTVFKAGNIYMILIQFIRLIK